MNTAPLRASSERLLEQARHMIAANQLRDAEMVLNALVCVDPENVEAWKTYLWLRQDQPGLDRIKDRALKTREIGDAGKREIIEFHACLAERVFNRQEAQDAPRVFPALQTEHSLTTRDSAVEFELLSTFNYPHRPAKRMPRPKPRRATYNFAVDIAGGLIAKISRHPYGKKVVARASQLGAQAKNLMKDPRRAYAAFAESPYFETISGMAALALFVLGARLAIQERLVGYLILAFSISAGRWWLGKFGAQGVAAFNGQVRTYLQENKENPMIAAADAEDRWREEKP